MENSRNPLKNKNMALMNHEFANNISDVRSFPTTIGIAANKTCNVNCIFCLAGAKSNEKISWNHFMKLENLFGHVNEVIFSGEEVILHPDIWKMFALLSDKEVFTSFFSNGKALVPETMERLVHHRVGRIACSFHGATRKTYESIVRGADFDAIVSQFEYLDRLRANTEKKTQTLCTPHVVFHYVMMRRNIEELPRFLELASRLGAQTVIAKFMMIYSHLKHLMNESLYFYPELTNEIIDHSISKSKGMPLNFVSPKKFDPVTGKAKKLERDICELKPTRQKYPKCSWPWRQCNIDVNGNVSPCCGGAPKMGNIYETPFEEIWNNERYIDLRATVNTPNRWPECQKCHDVSTSFDSNDIRRHLLFLKKKEPVESETINMKGLFTEDQKLHGLVLETLRTIGENSALKFKIDEIIKLTSSEEEKYLLNLLPSLNKNKSTLSKTSIFILAMIRFFNGCDRAYNAYRLINYLTEDDAGKKNYPIDQHPRVTHQIQLEKICSQFIIGYYSSGIEDFKGGISWIKDFIGTDHTRRLINILMDYNWKYASESLNDLLEKKLFEIST